jgi:hypothetical protein
MKRIVCILVVGAVISIVASPANAGAPPVGKLTEAKVITQHAPRGSLVSLALPKSRGGAVWRVARTYDGHVATEVEEHTLRSSVVIVFRAVASGHTTITYALTPSATSPRALRAVTLDLLVS